MTPKPNLVVDLNDRTYATLLKIAEAEGRSPEATLDAIIVEEYERRKR